MVAIVFSAVPDLYLSAPVALAAIAVLGYMVSRARNGRTEFKLLDAIILAVVVAIVGATTVPFIEKASRQAEASALLQNLHALRSQIELYKLEHGGQPPVLYEGTFPQLIRATNSSGIPGPRGSKHPFGPYLHSGIPVNPITGRSVITPTDKYPPDAASGSGGWIYHQKTGRISADSADFLNQ